MQTFLPYLGKTESARAYYEECAGLLDQKVLSKQRVDNLVIMKTLFAPHHTRWSSNSVVQMWKGYEWSLLLYQDAICKELIHNFGVSDTYLKRTIILYFENADLESTSDHKEPPWLYQKERALSQQSELIRKDPGYYMDRFPGVPDNLPHVRPVTN